MRVFFVLGMFSVFSISIAQSKISINEGRAEMFHVAAPAASKLIQVHQPSKSTGVMAVSIPMSKLKTALLDREAPVDKKLDLRDTTQWLAELNGKAVKVVGIGFAKIEQSLLIYLDSAVDTIPRLKFGEVEIEAQGSVAIDPGTIQSPKVINLLGFQPAAQLTDGSTAGVYQIGLDMPLGAKLRLGGVLSTNMKDKQANIALGFFPAKNFKLQATSSQLGTSQMLTAGYERTSFSGPEYPFNYNGEISPRFSSTTGIYFTRQLRVDSSTTGGADPGSGLYAATGLNIPVAFDASGFMKFNVGLNFYYFPASTANQFGTKQFEPSFDIGGFIPLQKPTQLKNGSWGDGMWLKLGLIQGVQPGNAFGKVSGFRFDIVKSF